MFIIPNPHQVDCSFLIQILFKNFVYERRERYFKKGLFFYKKIFGKLFSNLWLFGSCEYEQRRKKRT